MFLKRNARKLDSITKLLWTSFNICSWKIVNERLKIPIEKLGCSVGEKILKTQAD